jgi:hypothetical protein
MPARISNQVPNLPCLLLDQGELGHFRRAIETHRLADAADAWQANLASVGVAGELQGEPDAAEMMSLPAGSPRVIIELYSFHTMTDV